MSFYGRSLYEYDKIFKNFRVYNQTDRTTVPSEGFPKIGSEDIIYPNELYDTLTIIGADPWIQLNANEEEIALRHYQPSGNNKNYTLDFGSLIKFDKAGHIHLGNDKNKFNTSDGKQANLFTINIPTLPNIFAYNKKEKYTLTGMVANQTNEDLDSSIGNANVGYNYRGENINYITYIQREGYEIIFDDYNSTHNLNLTESNQDFRVIAADKWIELSVDPFKGGAPGISLEFRHHIPGTLVDNIYSISTAQYSCGFGSSIYFDPARHLVSESEAKQEGETVNSKIYSSITLPNFPDFIIENTVLNTQNVKFEFKGDKWINLVGDNAVIGNETKTNNKILFSHAKATALGLVITPSFGESIYFDETGHISTSATAIRVTIPNITMTCFS